jgi:dinuclear metal center YbgI/SA1388 family protein
MIRLKELCHYLDNLLPSIGLSDYCPNGLQVEGKESIGKIVTAVSASLDTIKAAIEIQADALIVHHGIFWQRDSYVIQGIKREKLCLLLEQGLSLFAYHLPLDRHIELGNNWKAAQDLGWFDLQPFSFMNGIPIGVKGKIPPTSREKVKENLEKYYQHSAICAMGGPEIIQSLALISGGAHKSISDAIKEGIDAFITGSFDEPIWHQAFEEKINFFALGHSATEKVGPQALANHLKQTFLIPSLFIDIYNPF